MQATEKTPRHAPQRQESTPLWAKCTAARGCLQMGNWSLFLRQAIERSSKQLKHTDMVDGASTKFGIKQLSAQMLEIFDDERPNMQHIISREPIALFNQPQPEQRNNATHLHNVILAKDSYFCTHHSCFDSTSQSTRTTTDHQHAHVCTCFLLFVFGTVSAFVQQRPQLLCLPRRRQTAFQAE